MSVWEFSKKWWSRDWGMSEEKHLDEGPPRLDVWRWKWRWWAVDQLSFINLKLRYCCQTYLLLLNLISCAASPEIKLVCAGWERGHAAVSCLLQLPSMIHCSSFWQMLFTNRKWLERRVMCALSSVIFTLSEGSSYLMNSWLQLLASL